MKKEGDSSGVSYMRWEIQDVVWNVERGLLAFHRSPHRVTKSLVHAIYICFILCDEDEVGQVKRL